jgi:hypothetical protein
MCYDITVCECEFCGTENLACAQTPWGVYCKDCMEIMISSMEEAIQDIDAYFNTMERRD